MRRTGLALPGLLLTAALAGAQQPPSAPAAPAADPKLDGYLLNWERKMKEVQSLGATFTRVEKDGSGFESQPRKYTGAAYYMKDGTGRNVQNLALLRETAEGKKEIHQEFICTGTYMYHVVPAQKEIKAYELPKPKPGQVGEDSFLSFMFGMRAEEAKKRYDLRLEREDANFIYVWVLPRLPQDKADFERARLVLRKDNFLPRQVWFKQANKDEIIWDIPAVNPNMEMKRQWFDAPKKPNDWKFTLNPKAGDGPPKISRSTGSP
jgi:TIGR03009 family protein